MKNKKIVVGIMMLILLSNAVLGAYNATYTKQDFRIALFDMAYGALGWIIGIFGFILLLFFAYIAISAWIRKKTGR